MQRQAVLESLGIASDVSGAYAGRWLDGEGRETHVISLASARLYSLMTSGEFLESLYYRLNVLRLEPA